MQVGGLREHRDSHDLGHDFARSGTAGFRVHPEVAHPGFSAMVVANLECDVLGISPGLVTDLGDRVSDGCARIISASIFYTVRDGSSQHEADLTPSRRH